MTPAEAAWREGWALCKASLTEDEAFCLTDDVEADAWADSETRAALTPPPQADDVVERALAAYEAAYEKASGISPGGGPTIRRFRREGIRAALAAPGQPSRTPPEVSEEMVAVAERAIGTALKPYNSHIQRGDNAHEWIARRCSDAAVRAILAALNGAKP